MAKNMNLGTMQWDN